MKNFLYDIGTKIYFGEGQIVHLPEAIKPYAQKVLLVYGGGSIKKSGLYDTVTRLFRENGIQWQELPGVELVFIVGADAALTLPRWYESAELGRLAMFAAATRPGFELGEEALRVLRERRFDVRPFVVPGIDISSSELRQRVAEGRTIRYLVPEAVREIIEEEQLYRKEADHGRLA